MDSSWVSSSSRATYKGRVGKKDAAFCRLHLGILRLSASYSRDAPGERFFQTQHRVSGPQNQSLHKGSQPSP